MLVRDVHIRPYLTVDIMKCFVVKQYVNQAFLHFLKWSSHKFASNTMFGYQSKNFPCFFPNCIILNHMSASVCSFNIWRTSTSNNINYRSFTLLHRIYLHIHWVFLICLVRFIPTLWLIQNLTKITVKTHTFFNTSIYIYSGKMLHSGWKAECQQSHPDVAKFF